MLGSLSQGLHLENVVEDICASVTSVLSALKHKGNHLKLNGLNCDMYNGLSSVPDNC